MSKFPQLVFTTALSFSPERTSCRGALRLTRRGGGGGKAAAGAGARRRLRNRDRDPVSRSRVPPGTGARGRHLRGDDRRGASEDRARSRGTRRLQGRRRG